MHFYFGFAPQFQKTQFPTNVPCPIPAETTFPMNASTTSRFSICVRATAPLIATAPSAGAGTDARDPRNFAMGVLAKLTITDLDIVLMG